MWKKKMRRKKLKTFINAAQKIKVAFKELAGPRLKGSRFKKHRVLGYRPN
jgi:hypothetical protein